MSAGATSRRVGLIGYPLGHSISPAFQQAAFDAAGLAVRYERWEVPPASLPTVEARLREDRCLGANVTVPHKQAVMGFLDRVTPTAVAVGAVNTIVRVGARLEGDNTDLIGFAQSIRVDGGMNLSGRRVVVLGAGGAARAVVAACLADHAADVAVCARRPEQAIQLVGDLARITTGASVAPVRAAPLDAADPTTRQLLVAADLIVNATPLGTAHHAHAADLPLDPSALHPGQLVCDLVYNPPLTPFLRAAAERGARTLNGLPMLIYQGAAAFERWTGRPAPVELMRRAAERALGIT